MKQGLIYPCDRCGWRFTDTDVCASCRLGAKYARVNDKRKRREKRFKVRAA